MPTIEHELQDRSERLPLILEGDYDEYFRMVDEHHYERLRLARRIYRMACAYGCVRIEREGMRIWWYLHRSTREHTMQLTTWDALGPVSHMNVDYPDKLTDTLSGKVTATTEESS